MQTFSPKILITGGDGQLAKSIRALSPNFVKLVFYNRKQLDVTNAPHLKSILVQEQPHFVLHTAAFTAVDLAEEENQKTYAHLINVKATNNIAHYCSELGIPLFFISTDYVFDGYQSKPYSEQDRPNPLNFYGETKLQAEQAILANCQDYFILRISGVYSEYGRNIFKTFYQKLQSQACEVVADQFSSPTYAKNIAKVILQMIDAYLSGNKQSGIYHFCSQEIVSWYDFACMLKSILSNKNISCESITPIKLEQHIATAQRPKFSALNCEKIYRVFKIEQPAIRCGMEEVLTQLRQS